jgi:hypothetical protein
VSVWVSLPDQADFYAVDSFCLADHIAVLGFGSDSPGTARPETVRKRPKSPLCHIRRDNGSDIGQHSHGPRKANFADPHAPDTLPTIDLFRQAGHFPAGRESLARGLLWR